VIAKAPETGQPRGRRALPRGGAWKLGKCRLRQECRKVVRPQSSQRRMPPRRCRRRPVPDRRPNLQCAKATLDGVGSEKCRRKVEEDIPQHPQPGAIRAPRQPGAELLGVEGDCAPRAHDSMIAGATRARAPWCRAWRLTKSTRDDARHRLLEQVAAKLCRKVCSETRLSIRPLGMRHEQAR